jgi:hypothetical protein
VSSLIQFRRDTAANWTSANPILAEGELGLETDTGAYKIGNGATAWNSLIYRELSPQVQTLLFAAQNDPSPPSSGNLIVYAKDIGGRILPKFIGPAGIDTIIQSAIFGNGVQILSPGQTTAFTAVGMALPTAVGTVSHPTLVAGNLRTQTRRGIVTSASTANSASELRQTIATCYRGDAAGLGGFFMTTRFASSTLVANQRKAIGLFSVTTAISTSQSPSSLTNCLFIGNDSADTNLQIMHNDGSGTCTKIDLGANFPANNVDAVYEVIFFAAPNDTTVSYRVVRFDTGSTTTGTISTDLPASTTFLAWHAYMNNGGTASAVVLEIMRYYLETDY